MKQAKCLIDKDYAIGTTDPRLFSSFIEHIGRAVYTGVYEPGHPSADEQGFRGDVLDLVRQLRVPLVRYPGGNFVSGYQWTDGIGPINDRPRRLDLAWKSIEPNTIGIDEFADWCKKANSQVMAAVNLGTGTPAEAGNMVEYCNHPAGTQWSDLRRRNGHEQPHDIKVWCLGNEMDGPWQIGQLSAEDYGKKAREAAKIMRWVDPRIELVACGSSMVTMPTFPEWDRIILEHLYEHVDYISLHRYYGHTAEVGDFLGSFADMEVFIHSIAATADYVRAVKRSKKPMNISFDEWNIWYGQEEHYDAWEYAAPRIEQTYNLLDALAFGGLLCTLLKNCDRVKIACLAQLVNAIAPILTEPGGQVIKQTTFYPFQQVSAYGRGEVLKTLMICPEYESKVHGEMPILQSAAVMNREAEEISMFILNCDQNDDVEIALDFRSFGTIRPLEHTILNGPDLMGKNSFAEPEKIKPHSMVLPMGERSFVSVTLPKLSWNMLRFSLR